jgi:peptidoglycan hydrolase-like protein with peptidoglycan-binding domain
MIFPPFDDPFGRKKLGERPPVKAPADLNWDAIEAKIKARKQPVSTGEPKYDSSGYLARMRQEDPWPSQDDKNTPKVSLTNCRFLTPDDLVPDETCTVACDVKILQPPTSREVVFQLLVQGTENNGWEDACSSGEVSLKSGIADQTVQVDLMLRSPDRRPDLGATVHYKVTAEHSEASAVVESPDTPVQMRNLCRTVGTPEIAFCNDGACPTLDESGGLVRAMAAAVGRLSLTPPEGQSPDTVVIAGFASSSGTADHDRDISLRRAQAIKALLGRDADAWGDLAANFTTADIQQILSGFASGFGWPCDPGAVDGEDGPNTQAGVKAFQAECNTRYSLGLDEDGLCGPKTWGAVHRAICALVSEASGQDPSAEPSWPDVPWGYSDGEGVYACGSDFAAPDDSAADRHAEICFFESNMEPPLTAPAPGEKATLADFPVEDPAKIKKVRMEVTGGKSTDSHTVRIRPEVDQEYDYEFVSGDFKLTGSKAASEVIELEIPKSIDTGELTVTTKAPIFKHSWTIKVGEIDPEDTTAGLQQRLINLGYFDQDADGQDSPELQQAIMDFQIDHEIPTTGICDQDTKDALQKYSKES